MTCEKWTENLIGLLTGEITEQKARQTREHLASCAGCRDELAEMKETMTAVKLSQPPDPGEEFWRSFPDRVHGAFTYATSQQSLWSKISSFFSGPAAVKRLSAAIVAAALLIAIGITLPRMYARQGSADLKTASKTPEKSRRGSRNKAPGRSLPKIAVAAAPRVSTAPESGLGADGEIGGMMSEDWRDLSKEQAQALLLSLNSTLFGSKSSSSEQEQLSTDVDEPLNNHLEDYEQDL